MCAFSTPSKIQTSQDDDIDLDNARIDRKIQTTCTENTHGKQHRTATRGIVLALFFFLSFLGGENTHHFVRLSSSSFFFS